MDHFHAIDDDNARYAYMLKTSTGVSPQDDDFVYVPCPSTYYSGTKSHPPVQVATDLGSSVAENLQGAGVVEEDAKPAALTAPTEVAAKLKPEEVKAIKSSITSAGLQAAKRGPLKVKSFQTGKKTADKEVDQALEEEGYGRKKRPKKTVSHSILFI